jgi:UDP-glucose 4-epimerase
MNILLTGGAGFIGSHVLEELHKKHYFTIIDDLSTGNLKNIEEIKIQFENAR